MKSATTLCNLELTRLVVLYSLRQEVVCMHLALSLAVAALKMVREWRPGAVGHTAPPRTRKLNANYQMRTDREPCPVRSCELNIALNFGGM